MHLPSPLLKSSPSRKSVLPFTTSRPDTTQLHPPAAVRPTFQDSLRKIPSTIFLRSDKERRDDMTTTTKTRTKTRKALGGLFGWGNSSAATPTPPPKPEPVFSAPAPAPAHAPAPAPAPRKLEKKPSAMRLDKKASIPMLRHAEPATLRAPAPRVARTSMSDDPFGAPTDGAEVVEHLRSVQAPSIKSEVTARERRRDSMCSSKAFSTKTAASDEISVREVAMRARMSSPRRVTMASVLEEKKRLSAQSDQTESSRSSTSSSLSTAQSTIVLPARTSSLGRSLNLPSVIHEVMPPAPVRAPMPQPVRAAPTPAPAPVQVHLPTPVAEPRLRKEKTKSKIWGFLGKKIKAKEPMSPDYISRPLELGTKITPATVARPIPVVHVSHPSEDKSVRIAMEQTRESVALGPKPLPKRKSLNGLFGLAIKPAVKEIQDWQPPVMRPLSEEITEAAFGSVPALSPTKKSPVKKDAGLRRVASATDKLLSLVTTFDFSPNASPTKGLVNMSSFSSLKNGTPTPIRRAQSAMLLSAPTPPPKDPIKVSSPVKQEAALLRKMEGIGMHIERPGSPPRKSMVKKGMRNPFAPPSPEHVPRNVPRRLGQGPNVGLAGCMDDEMVGDMPADLVAMLQAMPEPAGDLPAGIPPPPAFRTSRRQVRAAPAISLPPVPPVPTLPPSTPVEVSPPSPVNDQRASFDFEAEFDQLDRGNRDSFMAALHRVESSDMLAHPPLPPLPSTLYTIEQSPDSIRTKSPHLAPPAFEERKVSPARVRKAPFQGTVAFQQHVSRGREPTQTLPPTRTSSRGHSRASSSIATMSSIGDVIDTSDSPREYTNYFEVNFAQHLRKQSNEIADVCALSRAMAAEKSRAPTRRGHHTRNSSIMSIDSMGNLRAAGPPNSRLNKHRSGYVSRHRMNGSIDSTGRSDWAHRRNASTDSTASNASLARLGRPGLGDRMFQLDGAVNLEAIAASPHQRQQSWDSVVDKDADTIDSIVDGLPNVSYDSIVDGPQDASYDSIVDGLNTSLRSCDRPDPDFTVKYRIPSWDSAAESDKRISRDSVFGVVPDALNHGFFLKARPVSLASDSESDGACINAAEYGRDCIEAQGEAIGVNRTTRPRPATRRRPAHLVFGDPPLETPGLSSPSTSDSSAMSLDTRFSGQSFFGHRRQQSSFVKPQPIPEETSATLRAPRLAAQLSRENLGSTTDDHTQSVTAWLRFQREAEAVCQGGKATYRDTEASLAAVQAYHAKFSPLTVKSTLQESNAFFKHLEQVHRRKPSFTDSRALASPYGLPLPKNSVPSKPRGSLTTKFERSNSAQSRSSYGPSEEGLTPTSGIFDGFMPELAQLPAQRRSTPPSALTFSAFSPARSGDAFGVAHLGRAGKAQLSKGSSPPTFGAGPFMHTPRPITPKAAPAAPSSTMIPLRPALMRTETNVLPLSPNSRARVDSGERRKALGWGRRRNSDGPERVDKVLKAHEPASVADEQQDRLALEPVIMQATATRRNVFAPETTPVKVKTAPLVIVKPPSVRPKIRARAVVYEDKENDTQRSTKTVKMSSRRTGGSGSSRPQLVSQRALRA